MLREAPCAPPPPPEDEERAPGVASRFWSEAKNDVTTGAATRRLDDLAWTQEWCEAARPGVCWTPAQVVPTL